MSKRISLGGLILLAMTLPLYADISGSGCFILDNPSSGLHARIADSWISGTGQFSILDIRGQSNPANDDRINFSSLPPAFKPGNPAVPVPEPMHYALMGLGVAGLILARRDRRNAAK